MVNHKKIEEALDFLRLFIMDNASRSIKISSALEASLLQQMANDKSQLHELSENIDRLFFITGTYTGEVVDDIINKTKVYIYRNLINDYLEMNSHVVSIFTFIVGMAAATIQDKLKFNEFIKSFNLDYSCLITNIKHFYKGFNE